MEEELRQVKVTSLTRNTLLTFLYVSDLTLESTQAPEDRDKAGDIVIETTIGGATFSGKYDES